MRKLIIILIGAMAFVSCQKSNQEKAEDLIRKTMDAISQGDPDEEYKNLEFGFKNSKVKETTDKCVKSCGI